MVFYPLDLGKPPNINATGNSLTNRLIGNAYNNTLTGQAGNDYLEGMAGNDVLVGGKGADTMLGGLGNDTYNVDDVGDVVTELSGQGTDTVNSAINYTLSANVERLTLLGSVAINGTGNTLGNTITGNGAANVLTGDAGGDTLKGLAGNDALYGDSGKDSLEGGDGNDLLEGGVGNDTLIGGWGSDQYNFSRGDGQDLLNDYDSKDANPLTYGATTDVLKLSTDIAHDQLWFVQSGNDLLVQVIGSSDQVQIQNWYLGGAYQVEEIQAGDGFMLVNEQVDQLVQAMAAFAPPAAGELNLPSDYRSELDPVIAVNWQAA